MTAASFWRGLRDWAWSYSRSARQQDGAPFGGGVTGEHGRGALGGDRPGGELGGDRLQLAGLVDGAGGWRKGCTPFDLPAVELQPLGLVEGDRADQAAAPAVGGDEPAGGHRAPRVAGPIRDGPHPPRPGPRAQPWG